MVFLPSKNAVSTYRPRRPSHTLLSAAQIGFVAAFLLPSRPAHAAKHHHPKTNPVTAPAPVTPVTTPAPAPITAPAPTPIPVKTGFTITGLISPATVAESIFVEAADAPAAATVSYFIDNLSVAVEKIAPFWAGGQTGSAATGLSVANLSSGTHTLRAVATLPDGSSLSSNSIALTVVPSINAQLSSSLTTYANQPSAQQGSAAEIVANVSTAGAAVTETEAATRQAVTAMYLNWNIDPSLDAASDISTVLAQLAPKSWKAPAAFTGGSSLSMTFSPDAPFYHAIPALWPRVALPSGYVQQLQLNSAQGGDGIGYGETVAAASDPLLTVRSEWYSDASTLVTFPFRMKTTWDAALPSLTEGDSHVIFADPVTRQFVSTYKTTRNSSTGGPNALYASSPTPFNSLGDRGGSDAAGFAEAPVLVQPGEATNATQPIPHAIGGPVGRTWAARVYPATARDAGILTSTNSCTGSGLTNNGLIPYGGVIQLDPQLDLSKLTLSLPARRILQAMQTYGYYVMDFGCGDMDIYTAVNESEFEPYGGMYGNVHGPGVQNEVQNILTSHTLYVVAPLVKKQ